MNRHKRREPFPLHTTLRYLTNLAGKTASGPVLGFIFFFIWLSAMTYGCSWPRIDTSQEEDVTTVRLMETSGNIINDIKDIDILVFNNDRLQRLDSYQKTSPSSCATIKAVSRSGPKIITAIANAQTDRYGWAEICSREALEDIRSDLETESRDRLLMSGECIVNAGGSANLQLRKLCSEIRVRSICCDFSDRPYSGARLEDVRIYLINVNAEAAMITDKPYLPGRIINAGMLNMDDILKFRDRSMMMQEVEGTIGPETRQTGISLLCYPNESTEEGPGTPFTRLVIEGKVNGKTYYWPVNAGEDKLNPGVRRNCRYTYDIRITRLGGNDPDVPVEASDIEISTEVKEWEEKEEYGVRF